MRLTLTGHFAHFSLASLSDCLGKLDRRRYMTLIDHQHAKSRDPSAKREIERGGGGERERMEYNL